jgi:protein transport protein SEC20
MSTPHLQSLDSRLNALHEAHKNTIQLINRLATSKPHSATQTDPDLIAEIHESLKRQDEELEILRQELQDSSYSDATSRPGSDREREHATLAVQVARLGEDFKQYVDPVALYIKSDPF